MLHVQVCIELGLTVLWNIECCCDSTGFLWHKVEPNQEFQGLVCEGANVLPAKVLENSFGDGYGNSFPLVLICAML